MTPLAAQPNERTKRSRQGTQPALIPLHQAYEAFFMRLSEDFRRRCPGIIAQATKPILPGWFPFRMGRAGFAIYVVLAHGTIRVGLYLENGREKNKRAFDALIAQRQAVEEALGYSITWDRQDHLKQSRVFIIRRGSVVDSDESLSELREWTVQKVADFYRVFRPLVQQLEL